DNGKNVTITNLRAGKDGTQLENGTGTGIGEVGTKYDYFTVSKFSLNGEGYNGISNVSDAQKKVNIGDTVIVKFVIADVTDKSVNSCVLIEGGSLSFEPTNPSNKGTISGIVKLGSTPTTSSVVLMKGDEQVATTISNSNGEYSFADVEYGIYNIVATKDNKTTTIAVKIDSSLLPNKDIIIPDGNGNQNTVVETKPSTPSVSADLNNLFEETPAEKEEKGITQADKDVITAGGTVEIKLIAEAKNENTIYIDANKIKTFANSNTNNFLFMDLTVNKIVTPNGGETSTTKLKELNNLVDIIVEIPEEKQVPDLRIFRIHEDMPEELKNIPNIYGEKFVLSSDYKYATLTVRRFSTFALMGGTTSPTPIPPTYYPVWYPSYITATPKYTVTFNPNGGTEVKSVEFENSTKLIDLDIVAPTKDGYAFGGWYKDDALKERLHSSDIINENTRLYARWLPLTTDKVDEDKKETAVSEEEVPQTGDSWFDNILDVLF
ncbi:MAG: InlB B-repeat-containing protein, partial [Oscillospiraceae bacterium]